MSNPVHNAKKAQNLTVDQSKPVNEVEKVRTLTQTDASYNAIALAVFDQLASKGYRPKVSDEQLTAFLSAFAQATGCDPKWSAFLEWVKDANDFNAQAVITPALKALVADMRYRDSGAKTLDPKPFYQDLQYICDALHMNFEIAYGKAGDKDFPLSLKVLRYFSKIPQEEFAKDFPKDATTAKAIKKHLTIFDGAKFAGLHTQHDSQSGKPDDVLKQILRQKSASFVNENRYYWENVKPPTKSNPNPISRYQKLENFFLRYYDMSPTVQLRCEDMASLHYRRPKQANVPAYESLAQPTLETLALLDTSAFKSALSRNLSLDSDELETLHKNIIAERDAFLKAYDIPLSAVREYGRYAASLFFRGISAGEFDKACALLCRLNIENGHSDALLHPELVLRTLEQTPELVNLTFESTLFSRPEKVTWLQKAVEANDADFVERLLAHDDVDVNANNNSTKDTALHIACRNPNVDIEIVRLLLAKCDINAQNAKGETAPMIAAKLANDDLCRLFVEVEPAPNFNLRDKMGMSFGDYHDRLLSTDTKSIEQLEAEAGPGPEVIFPEPVKQADDSADNNKKKANEGESAKKQQLPPEPVVKHKKRKRFFKKPKVTEKAVNFRLKIAVNNVQKRLDTLRTAAMGRPPTSKSRVAALDLYNKLNGELATFRKLEKPTIKAKNEFLRKADAAINEKKEQIEADSGLSRLLWAIGVSLTGLGLVVITADAFYHKLRDGVFKAHTLDSMPGVSQAPELLESVREGIHKDVKAIGEALSEGKPGRNMSTTSELVEDILSKDADAIFDDASRLAPPAA